MARKLMDEVGSTLVLYTVAMVAMIGMAALAIDLGMLRKARAEAQRAADASALAGASAFLLDLTRVQESTEAVHRARIAVDTNYMNGVKFDSTSELTVTVIYDSVKVRVTARRASVPTWFARVFGLKSFPVGAKAAAVADYASGTNCVKPLALADLWDDAGDNVIANHIPDPGETWLWQSAPTPDTYNRANYAGDGTGTGFGSKFRDAVTRDWGMRVVLRPSVSPGDPSQPCPGTMQGGKCYIPGWWGLWGDANTLEQRFFACTGLGKKPGLFDDSTYSIGTGYEGKNGWTAAAKFMEDLYADDQLASWDATIVDPVSGHLGTVVGSKLGANWRASSRVWRIGLFHPDSIPAPAEDIYFNNIVEFFFEGCTDESGTKAFNTLPKLCGTKDVAVGRFLGFANGTKTGPKPGTLIRILRLVE